MVSAIFITQCTYGMMERVVEGHRKIEREMKSAKREIGEEDCNFPAYSPCVYMFLPTPSFGMCIKVRVEVAPLIYISRGCFVSGNLI